MGFLLGGNKYCFSKLYLQYIFLYNLIIIQLSIFEISFRTVLTSDLRERCEACHRKREAQPGAAIWVFRVGTSGPSTARGQP